MALKFLFGQVTQGSADAFAEAEITTGLSNVTRTAYRVRRIEWMLPSCIGADSLMQMTLTRKSRASISFALGNSLIAGKMQTMELTTSGMVLMQNFPVADIYSRDEELLIVEESLYLQIDSTGTSASNAGWIRLGYETRTITENERLQIQASTAAD